MGLESATWVGDLVATNPDGADGADTLDQHDRLIKAALRNSFPGFTGGIMVAGTDGGSANTYTLSPTTALPSYVVGMLVCAKITNANTSASTLNISGLGAGAIQTVAGAALTSGDLPAGRYAWMVCTATTPVFQLLGITKNYVDQLAFNTVLPAQAGNSGKFLKTDGTNASWQDLLVATQAQMEAASSNTVFASPGTVNWHPGVAKAWLKCDAAGGIQASQNITSITDDGTGQVTVTIATDFSSADYVINVSILGGSNGATQRISSQSAGAFTAINYIVGAAVLQDPTNWFFSCHGDQ